MSECGDLPRLGFLSVHVDAMRAAGLLMLLLCLQVNLIGVLKDLSGAFMTRQVIFFSAALGAGPMGMGGKVMVLSRYLL